MKKKLLYLSIIAINQNWHSQYPMSYNRNERLEGSVRRVITKDMIMNPFRV